MEAWRNGFSQAAVQTIQSLIDDNPELLATSADIKELINEYLSKVAVNPGTDNQTYTYQWAEWVDNGVEKKVSANFKAFCILTRLFVPGLLSEPAHFTHICNCTSRPNRRS